MKFIKFCILLLIIVFFASCTKPKTEETVVFVPDENTLRVIIDVYDKPLLYADCIETLNKRVWEAGFGVVFEMYERSKYYYRIDPATTGYVTNYPSYEDYLLEYRAFVEKNLSSNSVYVIDSRYQEFIDGLYYGGKLGDHSEAGEQVAPDYIKEPQVARYNNLSNGEMYSIPLFFEELNSGALALFIQEEIANEWGEEIRTSTEFEEFLTWRIGKIFEEMAASGSTSIKKPCLIPYTLGDYWPFNLYLPDVGYMPVGEKHSGHFVLDLN